MNGSNFSLSETDRLQQAFDAFSDGVVIVDPCGKVAGWNPAASRLTGMAAGAVVGRPFPLATGTSDDPVELRIEDRWVEIVETALDDGGSVVEIRDISNARSLDAARTMFLATTSHELKTPLTAINGFARWLQTNLDGDLERRATAVDALVSGVDELNNLVEKILLSARTEIGGDDVVVEPTEVVPLLSAIAAQFAVPDTSHRLTIDVTDPALMVRCDRRAMRTAIGQLIENAIKYSPEGGDVILGARSVDDNLIELTVQDHGIGLDPKEAEYLFIAFYQGEHPEKNGVGLGLSIVRRLVEAQGGTVTATGKTGEGATFAMLMPCSQETRPDIDP